MADSQPTTAEPIPQRDDYHKAKRNVFFRHLAHEGIMLNRVMRQQRHEEKLKKFAATGDTKDLATSGEDDMGVNIGNEYHVHQVMPTTESKSTPPPSAIGTSIGSRLWPLVLGAAVACGSTGIGYLLANWRTDKPAADTDTDTITEMDFPK